MIQKKFLYWYNLSNIKFGTPKYQDRIITEYINNYD